jgi:hypothetical protein
MVFYPRTTHLFIFSQLFSGETSKEFTVDVLHNAMAEWHETFMVVLEELVDAKFGDLSMTTITIIDREVSGGVILPAPPIVSAFFMNYPSVKMSVVME